MQKYEQILKYLHKIKPSVSTFTFYKTKKIELEIMGKEGEVLDFTFFNQYSVWDNIQYNLGLLNKFEVAKELKIEDNFVYYESFIIISKEENNIKIMHYRYYICDVDLEETDFEINLIEIVK